ncbi:MAG: cytochrome C oxidase subunit IV family protein, partial [Chitinophagaceae bacterium]
ILLKTYSRKTTAFMSAHSTNSSDVQVLYEGDQSKLYSGLMSHHRGETIDSAASKKQIGRLMKVTIILAVVTALEVILGLTGNANNLPHWLTATLFLIMTVFKAAYIVRVFMHLGDEVKNMIITVMIPLTLFIWFILAFLADGSWWLHMNHTNIVR